MQPARLSALRQTVRTLAFHEEPDLALGLCFPSLTDSRRLVAVLPLAVVPLEATKLFVATRTRRNHRDSPPEHIDQSSAPFGSYTFACGQSAACGNGQPDPAVWTNDDLEKLHDVPGLISIVGQIDEEGPAPESEPRPYVETQDPEWYAQQAAKLSDELESRQAQLRDYLQAIEDARNLRDTTGGINFAEGAIAITLDDGIDLLEWRVEETQAAFDDLEDLARRNGIPPGTLRGQ